MSEIEDIINDDPGWSSFCLRHSDSNSTCADDIEGKISKVSPYNVFKIAFGNQADDLTQFAIDFALFGLARDEKMFNMALPLFSKDF